MSQYMLHPNPRPFAMLDGVRAQGLERKSVLAPREDIPILHYYFPQMKTEPYSDASEIPAKDRSRFDGVIYPDHSVR